MTVLRHYTAINQVLISNEEIISFLTIFPKRLSSRCELNDSWVSIIVMHGTKTKMMFITGEWGLKKKLLRVDERYGDVHGLVTVQFWFRMMMKFLLSPLHSRSLNRTQVRLHFWKHTPKISDCLGQLVLLDVLFQNLFQRSHSNIISRSISNRMRFVWVKKRLQCFG